MAGALQELGVRQGDRVLLYMPMIPEAAFAMLACARLGAIHSVVFGGFASASLAARIDDARPTVIVSADAGSRGGKVIAYKPLLDEAIALAHAQAGARACWSTAASRRGAWSTAATSPRRALRARHATRRCRAPGSTPRIPATRSTPPAPPAGPRACSATPAATRSRWRVEHAADLRRPMPGETYFCTSDIGWVVGHSYIVYGPLIAGMTTLMYEGLPTRPDAPAIWWRLVEKYKVSVMFSSPTAIRVLKKQDPAHCAPRPVVAARAVPRRRAARRADGALDHGRHRQAGHRQLLADRERLADPDAANGVEPACRAARLPRQADVRLRRCCCSTRRPARRSTAPTRRACSRSRPRCRPAACRPCGATTRASSRPTGAASPAARSTPPSTGRCATRTATSSSWAAPTTSSTWPATAWARARSRRASPAIRRSPRSAVVGVADALKGQVAMAFAVPRDAAAVATPRGRARLEAEVMKRVDEHLGAVARPARVRFVGALPKTRSGKLLRRTIQAICEGRDPGDLTTLDDPAALAQIRALVESIFLKSLPCDAFPFALVVGLVGGAVAAAPSLSGPAFPRFESASALTSACDAALAEGGRRVKTFETHAPDSRWLAGWDDLNAWIEDASGPVSLLENVHPDKAMRDAAQACTQRWAEFASTLGQNESLYRALTRVKPRDAIEREFVKFAREGFEDSGVSLAPADRASAKQLNDRVSDLDKQFEGTHPRRQRQGAGRRCRSCRRAGGCLEVQAARRRRQGAARPRLSDPGASARACRECIDAQSCSGAPSRTKAATPTSPCSASWRGCAATTRGCSA